MRTLFLHCCVAITLLLQKLQAQNTYVVENSTGAQGFELSNRDLYWWHSPTLLDGDNYSTLARSVPFTPRSLEAGQPDGGFLPAGALAASGIYTPFLFNYALIIGDTGGPAVLDGSASVVRDAEWCYYVRQGLVRRRLVAGGTAAVEENVTRFDGIGAATITASGCCLLLDDRLWYHEGGTVSSVALTGPLTNRAASLHFITPGGGTVKKMTVCRSQQAVLTLDGRLYFKNELTGAFSGQQLVSSGVNDFALRRDRIQIFGGSTDINAVYGADNAGVWRWNPAQAIKEYLPAGGGLPGTITSVALDANRIFVSGPVFVPGQGNVPYSFRKLWPREQWLQPWNQNWDWITATLGDRNLRSDGQWLYGLQTGVSGSIRAIATGAPALRLDVEVRGMEVVQVIQNLDNDVPLIAGREAWVRGYAWLAENTTAFGNGLRFPAELQVKRDGISIARLTPVNDPYLTNADDMAAWRRDVRRGYLFRVPGELISAGLLEFRFTVNPAGNLPETADAPRSNTLYDFLTAVAKAPTVLPFVRIETTFGTFEPADQPATFRDNLERARSLLPVSRIIPVPRPTIISKPIVKFCEKDVLGIPVPYPCFTWRPFDMKDEDGDALQWLNTARMLHPAFLFDALVFPIVAGSSDIHWCGTAPAAVADFNGRGYTNGTFALVARMTSEAASNAGPWDRERGGRTLAHELGHNYGRQHINFGDPACPCDPEPVPGGPGQFADTNLTLAATCVGFDGMTQTAVPATNGTATMGDLMSYASSRWTSRQTYMAIMNAIPNAPAGAARTPRGGNAGDRMLVRGQIDRSRTAVSFLPVFALPAGAYPPDIAADTISRAAALPASSLRLRLLDASGSTLAETGVLLEEERDEEANGPDTFMQFTVCPPATARVQVLKAGAVIGDLPFSSHAPVPGVPVVSLIGDALRAAWTGTDEDGDRLSFSVQFSNDGGNHWTSLAAETPELSLTVAQALLPGGPDCRVKVIATDGTRTSSSQSAAFSIARRPPVAGIGGISVGEQLPFGALRELTASITDGEDGALDDNNLAWTLRDLQRGTQTSGSGTRFLLNAPAPGGYEITLTATDSDGMTGTRTVPFSVRGITIPDTAEAPLLDGIGGDAAYAQSPVLRMDFGEGLLGHAYGTAVFAHYGGRLYVCITDLQKATGLARVRLLFDTNHNGGAPQSQDVAVEVNESGALSEWHGNGTDWVQAASPGGALLVALLPGAGSWSVELSLPDALLGGWHRDAGLAVVHYTIPVVGAWPAGISINPAPAVFASAGLGVSPASVNVPPVASAGTDRVLAVAAGDPVTLDASQSTDPEGAALSFSWQQLSGPALSVTAAGGVLHQVRAPLISGASVACRFRVTVSDGTLSAADEVTLTFTARNSQILPASAAEPVRLTPAGVAGSLIWPDGAGKLVMMQTSTNLLAWQDIGVRLTDIFGRADFAGQPPGPEGRRYFRLRSFTPGPVVNPGTALRFDGTDGQVLVPHDPGFNSYPMTASAYVLTTTVDPQQRGIIGKYIGSSLNGFQMFLQNGHVRAWYFRDGANYVWNPAGDGSGIDGGMVADGFWHHITMVVDASGGRLYVDGNLIGSLPWTGTPGPSSTTASLKIGRYDLAPSFTGDIDDVKYWTRALHDDELQEVGRVSPNAGVPDLLSIWRFDEGNGTTAASETTGAFNGALSGVFQWVPSSAPVYRQQ